MKNEKLTSIRIQASNLLKLLLEIPISERTEIFEQLDIVELHLSNLIDKLDEKIYDYSYLNIELDLSDIDWKNYFNEK
jgi:hypothetical protein